MSSHDDYSKLVAQAESAVKSVKDPELRRVAFEKVLDNLLTAESGPARKSGRISQRAASRPKAASSTGGRKSSRGPMAYIEEMISDNFFKKPKTIAEVKAELENRGHHIALTSLSGPLQKLTQKRVLRRERKKISGNKATFVYSNY